VVKIRMAAFIPSAWIPSADADPADDRVVEFEGDDRGFTPHAVNTLRSRIEQEAVVDFRHDEVRSYARTGVTRKRVTDPDGTITVREGRAGDDGIAHGNVEWTETGVTFELRASASNPLRDAPTTDYRVRADVTREGTVRLRGEHDGYPSLECYAQTDFGEFRPLYTHDVDATGDTPTAMAGSMEYRFDRTA